LFHPFSYHYNNVTQYPYTEDFSQASEHLRLVLPFLSKHQISASPLNYQMGYEYVSGRNEDLQVALNDLLSHTPQPSAEALLKLYQRFVVQNDAALESVREESLIDALTGIANRKAFDRKLEEVYADSEAQGSPFCLVISDIDHFKKFNDNFGHLVGDKVLRYVASTIKSCVKGKDTAARFGGEEFVLILPDTELENASVVADQIRRAVSTRELKDKRTNMDYGRITISLGVAQFQPGEDAMEILNQADAALYQAKENGRNRVEIAA